MEKFTISKLAQRDGTESMDMWLLRQGLEGADQQTLLQGYCRKLVDEGVPLFRVHVAQRAFHPQFGGFGFDWLRESGVSQESYAHSDTPIESWLASPLYHLLNNDMAEIRDRLMDTDHDSQFPMLNDLKAQGVTDYFATGLLFEKHDENLQIDPNNTPEGILISWASDGPDGFSPKDIDLIRNSLPYLGLALKSASNRQIARDLLGVYLGRDAGNRVLSGEFRRGSSHQINAVICYFDLTGFTILAEQTPGADLIEMLNDYFGLAVAAIQGNDGHVLKFMGDGMLAMFDQPDMATAAAAALDTAVTLRQQIDQRNHQRRAQGLPSTGFTLALHAGDILYGNIGAENRLDFTVIGPAVNLTARLSGMHRSVDQNVIVSQQIYQASQQDRHNLISLGRYMLRGVSEPQELFTIYDGG